MRKVLRSLFIELVVISRCCQARQKHIRLRWLFCSSVVARYALEIDGWLYDAQIRGKNSREMIASRWDWWVEAMIRFDTSSVYTAQIHAVPSQDERLWNHGVGKDKNNTRPLKISSLLREEGLFALLDVIFEILSLQTRLSICLLYASRKAFLY